MPTYEYKCRECDHHWEELQKISAPALDTCPVCEKKSAQRLISAGNFILKGGGWYADLYSSSKPKNEKPDAPSGAPASTEGASAAAGGEPNQKTAAPSSPAEKPSSAAPKTSAES